MIVANTDDSLTRHDPDPDATEDILAHESKTATTSSLLHINTSLHARSNKSNLLWSGKSTDSTDNLLGHVGGGGDVGGGFGINGDDNASSMDDEGDDVDVRRDARTASISSVLLRPVIRKHSSMIGSGSGSGGGAKVIPLPEFMELQQALKDVQKLVEFDMHRSPITHHMAN